MSKRLKSDLKLYRKNNLYCENVPYEPLNGMKKVWNGSKSKTLPVFANSVILDNIFKIN